jgi:hypothetical protein
VAMRLREFSNSLTPVSTLTNRQKRLGWARGCGGAPTVG